MKRGLLLFFVTLLSVVGWGQNGLIGDGFGTANWSNIDNFSDGAGSSAYYSAKPNGTNGEKFFRLVDNYSDNLSDQFGPTSTSEDYLITIGTPVPTAEVKRGSTSKAYKINATSTYNYVFKTKYQNETSNNGNLIVFEVQGNVENITNVAAGTVSPYNSTIITATLSNPFSVGQGAYLRYTNNDFTNSVVVPMTGSGTTYTAEIPAEYNIPGVEVKYYVFTSGDSLTIAPADADFYTINLKNNTGSNYSYTPTSNINWCNLQYPDSSNNTLVMGQDYTMKSQVFISGLTDTGTTVDSSVTCWFGYSDKNTHPDTWTNWVQASSSSDTGNNYEYQLSTRNLLPSVSNGTFYVATRYKYNTGDYVYGGWNTDNGASGKGGFWGRTYNGTVSVSGKFVMEAISLFGPAVGGWTTDVDMYSNDGDLFSTTVYLAADQVKFRRKHDTPTWGKGPSGFPSGTSNSQDPIDVNPAGTYLVTFDISSGEYTFSNINCTSSSTTTWNGSSWSNYYPDFTKKAIIEGDYNTTSHGNLTACECEIKSGKTVTVADNTYFTVAHKITNNGTIIVNHQGNVIQYSNETNDGTGTYQVNKTTSQASDYDFIYWGSPLSAAHIQTVFSENPSYKYEFMTSNFIDLNSGSSYPQTTVLSDGYDDNGDDWSLYNSGPMTPGKGYIVMVKGSEMPINTSNLADIDINNEQNVVFTGGVFNNGDITFTTAQDGTNDADTYNNNLNFVSNPYPSAISADRFIAANSTLIDGTLYFWTHKTAIAPNAGPNAYDFTNADFATYSTAGGVASANGGAIPTGNIASCQGFMVPVKEGVSGSIVFNNNMRLAVNNNNFYKQAQASSTEKDRTWLNLTTANGLYRQILVAFLPEATIGADQALDAARMPDATTDDFYSLIDNQRYAIQALPAFEDTYQIPLGMQLKADNSYQIALDHTEGIFTQGQAVYLEDTYQDIIHDFANGAYSFTQTAGNDINDRFVLRFTKTALGNSEQSLHGIKLYPNPVHEVLNLYNPTGEAIDVEVYDATGKLILTQFDTNTVNFSNFARGWYFVKLTGNSGTITQKIILD